MFKWLIKPANWYEFWLPQSGFSGGAILGLVVALIIYLCVKGIQK